MAHSADRRRRLWGDQEGLCPLCELPIPSGLIDDRDLINIDHIISQSHGGSDAYANLQLTHRPCNERKGCGCPPGNRQRRFLPGMEVSAQRPDHGEKFVQSLWRAQNFCCGICGTLIPPSEVLRPELAKLADGEISHVPCIERKYRR